MDWTLGYMVSQAAWVSAFWCVALIAVVVGMNFRSK